MYNYQSQQFWNDINGIIGFAMSVAMIGFVVGMVKPMGKFIEPPFRPEKHLPKPVAKVVTVPGGSHWSCAKCGVGLEPGEQAVKIGAKVYCVKCARGGNPDGEFKEFEEFLRGLPFMPEKGKPLPDYVYQTMAPEFITSLMKAPVSGYGRELQEKVVLDMALFLKGGNFEIVEKLDESGWSSEDVAYDAKIRHKPTNTNWDIEIWAPFGWRKPETYKDGFVVFLSEELPEHDFDLTLKGGEEAGRIMEKFRLSGNPNTATDESWDNVLRSCRQAAKILGKEITEQDIPANWDELRRLHKDLWAQVYGKRGIRQRSRSSSLTTKVYHVTHKDNLEGIKLKGLEKYGQYLFFFSTLGCARESALSDMVILEVTLVEDDIDKCEVGEIFPELYEEKFGRQPPGDVSLRSYIGYPVPYGIAEVACTISRVPPERIRYVETISRLKGGNPGNFRLEQTTVDRVTDDLERTWGRIAPDIDLRMQSALGILKEVMGYYYEEPCVVVWGNSNLVGIAVYETSTDVNIGVQSTHIKELASFTHEPGVGKLLVEEVIRIGRGEDSDIVSASYGPGARGFYEGLGFVRNTYYPENPTLMMYRLKNGN